MKIRHDGRSEAEAYEVTWNSIFFLSVGPVWLENFSALSWQTTI